MFLFILCLSRMTSEISHGTLLIVRFRTRLLSFFLFLGGGGGHHAPCPLPHHFIYYFYLMAQYATVQPERNARTKFSYNQFANLVAFDLHVNLARIWPNWLKTKFSSGVSFWLYCMLHYSILTHPHPSWGWLCWGGRLDPWVRLTREASGRWCRELWDHCSNPGSCSPPVEGRVSRDSMGLFSENGLFRTGQTLTGLCYDWNFSAYKPTSVATEDYLLLVGGWGFVSSPPPPPPLLIDNPLWLAATPVHLSDLARYGSYD